MVCVGVRALRDGFDCRGRRSLLDSSFPAADSSDDDLGMDIEQFENPHYNPDSEQGIIRIL